MSLKEEKLLKEQTRNKRLLGMVKTEREKTAGYEQLAKVHSAYIAILLKKLGATKEQPVIILAEDVTEALESYETRAFSYEDGSWGLYCETVGGE